MTGPEHYREAERLVVRAHHFTYGDGADPVTGHAIAAEAQVHATLALAAAYRAEVLREAADVVGNDDTCGCGGCDTCTQRELAAELRRMADEAGAA